tara:strand:+ start:1818 stop:1991 length:174 start_codon:yes stop_codon:yes gene_type:complete
MSEETRINGKTWKKIQAGQDWSDSDTWKGLAIVIIFCGIFVLSYYMGWFDNPYYNWK